MSAIHVLFQFHKELFFGIPYESMLTRFEQDCKGLFTCVDLGPNPSTHPPTNSSTNEFYEWNSWFDQTHLIEKCTLNEESLAELSFQDKAKIIFVRKCRIYLNQLIE